LQELIISLGIKNHGQEKINQHNRETEHYRHIQGGTHHQITKHTKMNETPKKKNQTKKKRKKTKQNKTKQNRSELLFRKIKGSL